VIGLLILLIIIGLITASVVHPHWFRQYVLYRRQHLESIEARRPFCVATKQLSERQLCELVKLKLPDTGDEKGSIKLTPGTGKLKNNPNQLHFAVLGNWWVGGRAGTIKTGEGRQRPSTMRISVIVDHKNDEAIATLIALTWTVKKGIFERYTDLVKAQDKMLEIVQVVDQHASAFTEG
jgi:hypothetical protein